MYKIIGPFFAKTSGMECTTMKKLSTRRIATVAVFSALATIVMFFEFPILPTAPFLKIDLSDVVVIIGGFILGPLSGILIALCKVLLHWIITGGGFPALIGDFISFICSLAIFLPLIYKKRKITIIKAIVAVLLLTIVASVLNYFVMLPLYIKLFNFNIGMPISKYILTAIIPFNIIKGVILIVVSSFVIHKLQAVIKKQSKSL